MTYKQVILIRSDLKLPKGKMAVQAAHASVEAVLRSDKNILAKWRSEGMKKVALKIDDQKELHRFEQYAKDEGITTAVIIDAGRTTIAPGTITCLAIGPDLDTKIDKITAHLKMV